MTIQNLYPNIDPTLLLDFANVKALDPRITFARASAATYYGTDTAKAEENLFVRSQDFTTTWINIRTTDAADTDTAPDGTLTADSVLQESGQISFGAVYQSVPFVSGLQYTVSVFAKPNGKNFVVIRERSTGADRQTFFNVSTGSVGTTDAGHTATITASTNGYYRCSITFTASTTASQIVYFFVADTDGSQTVTDSGGLYLWGAQLEQRSAATAYTATTNQPITNYIPVLESAAAGEARFDHNPTTFESLGLLIEESRTNLFVRSEEFDNAEWAKNRSSIVANTIVAPSGELTGNKLIANTDSNNHNLQQSATVVASSTNTVSVYMKAGEYTFGSITANNGAIFPTAFFNLATGDAGLVTAGSSSTMQSVGNGWYRCTLTFTMASGTTTSVFLLIGEANNNQVFAGDGFSGIFIWGAQLEAGAFATSYIPTSASQVTRAADSASMTGANFSSWYNAAEGTLFAEGSISNIVARNGALVDINDNTSNNRLSLFRQSDSQPVGQLITNGVNQAQTGAGATWTTTTSRKLALTYAANDFAFTANGGAVGTDNILVLASLTQLTIGVLANQQWINGHIRKVSYYPKRIANDQLQGLTT